MAPSLPRPLARVRRAVSDPSVHRRLNGWAAVFWIAMAPPSMVWWKDSIPYLVGVSVYALVASHVGAWQAARTEERQVEAAEVAEGAAERPG